MPRSIDTVDPASPDFAMEDWPMYWIARVERQYAMNLDRALKRVDMDMARWRVLMILSQLGPSSMSTLAEHAVIKLPTMVKTVLRMEGAGLVSTSPSERDKRVTLVELTAEGKERTEVVRDLASRIFQVAFQEVPSAEAKQLIGTLKTIFDNLQTAPR